MNHNNVQQDSEASAVEAAEQGLVAEKKLKILNN